MSKLSEISVLMPVFNAERYLKLAIDSILNQTFQDFEFVIINDGSTDSSEEIILSYNDSRIKYHKNAENIGLIATLNKGIDLCNGRFVARMDADDISLPERLQKQWDFLNKRPEIVMVGSDVEMIDMQNQRIKDVQYCPAYLLKTQLFFSNTFAHPSILIRKDILSEFAYNADYIYAEDYFLWSQIAFKYPVANLPEILIKYRVHQESVSLQNEQQQNDTVKKVHAYHFEELGIAPSAYELCLHYKLLYNPASIAIFNKSERKNISAWIDKLIKQNEAHQIYDQKYFSDKLKYRWSLKRKLYIVFLKIRDKFRNR
jgi:glycosyltransferase involved in cell wall biosynthesis